MCRSIGLKWLIAVTVLSFVSIETFILLDDMKKVLREKIIEVCESKIEKKGSNVGLSFYAFFANKNDNPQLLMEAAEWWIMTHQLDHFEKATKIKSMIESMNADN